MFLNLWNVVTYFCAIFRDLIRSRNVFFKDNNNEDNDNNHNHNNKLFSTNFLRGARVFF